MLYITSGDITRTFAQGVLTNRYVHDITADSRAVSKTGF